MRSFSKYWIISGLVVLASFTHMPSTWADACKCTVTSLSPSTNFQTPGCTLYKQLAAGCTQISIEQSVLNVSDPSKNKIALPIGIQIKGVTITGPSLKGKSEPALTITTAAGFSEASLFQLNGGSALKNLIISAPDKTAVQMVGSDNTVSNVVVNNSAIGFQLDGNGGSIIDSTITGTTLAGAKITGASYTLSSNQFITNKGAAIQLTAATTKAIFDQNIFAGNANAVEQNSGNSNIPPPAFMWAIHPKGNDSVMTLITIGLGAGKVTAYLADAAEKPQGKPLAASIEIVPFSFDGFFLSDIYKMDVSSVPKDADLVMTYTNSHLGTSAFSKEKFKISKVDEAPTSCLSVPWFVKSVYELYTKGSTQSVWAYDFDGDGMSNGQEDKNRDCVAGVGETDPATYNKPIIIIQPPVNWCLVIPALCAKLLAQDTDNDGITDDKDNCPTVGNPDQKDTDGDAIGDICDPDMDNDGLSNKYCDPSKVYTKGQACDMVGEDQEGAVNSVPSVTPPLGLTTVPLDPKNADSDGDGYCDGPGFGPIVDGKLSVCKDGISDNCPTVYNADQWDDDEDGIGNACDESPWALQAGSMALTDSDHDGFKDYTDGNQQKDNCPSIANPDQMDTDGDKIGDACDSDDDNDGVLDVVENSTRYMIVGNGGVVYVMMNPLSAESDVDITPTADAQNKITLVVSPVSADKADGCDGSGAGPKKADGTFTCTKPIDKCPILSGGDCNNLPGKAWTVTLDGKDLDPDCPYKHFGIMDAKNNDIACNPDMDGDGVPNWAEDAQFTHFWEPDSDHHYKVPNPTPVYDGYCDGPGVAPFDVMTQQEATCTPSDSCPTIYNPSSSSGAQPDICHKAAKAADADNDGVPDAKDNCPKPIDPNPDQADMDGDGIGDVCDTDIDGDGLPNDADKCAKYKDPTNICVGANPGGSKPPPTGGAAPVPGVNGAMQSGGGCSLMADASVTAQALPMLAMVLAPLLAFVIRRRRRAL